MKYGTEMYKLLLKNPHIFLEILLEKNKNFQLSPQALVVLQYLWLTQAQQKRSLSHQELAAYIHIPEQTVRPIIVQLIKDNYLHLVTSERDGKIIESYDLAPLVNKCFEADFVPLKPTNAVQVFVEKVEHEFSRKLSPIEIQYIQGWVFDQHVSITVLDEALKETVLAGVRNFKYMNAIINNWQNDSEKKALTQNYRAQNNAAKQTFSRAEKEIAEFDWERALNDDE